MKKTGRFAAIAAAAMMTAALTVPMMGMHAVAEGEGSISISNSATGHTYEAYQIFDGDLVGDVLSNIIWGVGIDSTKTEALMAELKAIDQFKDCDSAAKIAEKLAENTEKDAALTKQFAAVVAKYLGSAAAETSDGNYSMTGLDNGYYLVKDKDNTLEGVDDAMTRYIVEVLGTKANIVVKSSTPSVIKKVKENVKQVTTGKEFAGVEDFDFGDGYNDVADYSIGDAVPFKLYGTLPSTLSDYSKYKYVFHDMLGNEFTAPNAETVNVYIDDKVTDKAQVTVEGNVITVTFDDIIAADANAESIVTVEYSAVLNAGATIGLSGQTNEVYLTYSNNPNWVGTPENDTPDDKGKTPEDKVIVFTYELDTIKVDGDNTDSKLAGAKFTMKATDGDHAGKYVQIDGNNKVAGWTDDAADAAELESDENGLFKVIGLDSGTYELTETAAPEGYNKLDGPVEVVLTATTKNDQAWDDFDANTALTALTVTASSELGTVDTNRGIGTITIANNKGSSLPSTGSIGTVLFYIVGGTLFVGAGVTLITKKRVGKNDK